jgi:hypothetical protein
VETSSIKSEAKVWHGRTLEAKIDAAWIYEMQFKDIVRRGFQCRVPIKDISNPESNEAGYSMRNLFKAG